MPDDTLPPGAVERVADRLTPLLALRQPQLEHNIGTMAEFCERNGLALAPHAKTHMAPELMRRQLEAGAWGITVASVPQLAVACRSGARRALLANEPVARAEVDALHALRRQDPELEAIVFVDSVAGVELLDRLSAGKAPLEVLIEVGAPGGRAGTRDEGTTRAVAASVAAAEWLDLVGVATYEGALGEDREPETLARIDAHLGRVGDLARALYAEGAFVGRSRPILSAGGSLYPDRVARTLGPLRDRFEVLLRAGAYIAHDDGFYDRLATLPLQPALELWSHVRSVPEPGLAIADFGKRDSSYDLGLPVAKARVLGDMRSPLAPEEVEVFALGDQHAYLRCRRGAPPLAAGDLLIFGISHPCAAFDRWSRLPLIDDRDRVLTDVCTCF